MKGRSTESAAAVAETAPATKPEPLDPFEGVTLRTPLLQLAKQALGPFLQHRTDCAGEACTCGLRAAIQDLERRENIVTRYGTIE